MATTKPKAEQNLPQGATKHQTGNSGARVTIACKIPTGLELRLAAPMKVRQPVLGGGVSDVTEFRQMSETVVVFGPSTPQNAAPNCIIVGGFALTPNVSKEFWDKWLEQNKEHAAVKNGMIYAYDKEADTRAHAKEHAKVKSNLERLDPKNPPKTGNKAVRVEPVSAVEEQEEA